jgi:hypothetical protein
MSRILFFSRSLHHHHLRRRRSHFSLPSLIRILTSSFTTNTNDWLRWKKRRSLLYVLVQEEVQTYIIIIEATTRSGRKKKSLSSASSRLGKTASINCLNTHFCCWLTVHPCRSVNKNKKKRIGIYPIARKNIEGEKKRRKTRSERKKSVYGTKKIH